MFDYRLRFDSEEQAKSVLYTKVPIAWGETYRLDGGALPTEFMDQPNYDCIDIIGAIYKPTGETDEKGNPVMADVGGYHCNIRTAKESPELDPYVVTPNNPVRIWSGD